MEPKIRQGYLYDFYGELLNEHQKEIFEAYVLEDLSLKEIADDQGISRQGVSDLIHRCTNSLEEYEAKLHLIEKFMSIKDKVDEIVSLTDASGSKESLQKIRVISDAILEEL
ncbi:MAG: YlxM family DNA-binding protein [Lachnospiraceae bacterium]|nr:YlxM family DNA-binding protein [Lachnospiraceae bacterium]